MPIVEHALPTPVMTEYPKWVHQSGKPSVLAYSIEEEIAILGPNCPVKESWESQVRRLITFLDDKIPEEVRPDEMAVDCAMRLLSMALEPSAASQESAAGPQAVEVGNHLTAPRRGPGRPPKAAGA